MLKLLFDGNCSNSNLIYEDRAINEKGRSSKRTSMIWIRNAYHKLLLLTIELRYHYQVH